jgi:hypothetical protein
MEVIIMKRIGPLSAIALVLVLLSAAFVAGCADEDGQITLSYDYREGDTFTYDVNVDMSGTVQGEMIPPGRGELPEKTTAAMRLTMEVLDVTEGVATVVYSYSDLTVTADGEPVRVPKRDASSVTVRVDEQGKIVSVEGLEHPMIPGFSPSQLPFDPSQFAPQTNVVYPEGGLAQPGDTWQVTSLYPVPGSDDGIESTMTGRLISLQQVDGRQAAEIEFQVETPLDLMVDLAAVLQELGLAAFVPQSKQFDSLTMSFGGLQTTQGEALVDAETGMPIDVTAQMTADLTIRVIDADPSVVPENLRGPTTIDFTAAVKVEQVK